MRKMKFVYSLVLVLVLVFSLVRCQYAQSPCPGIFDYERDDTGIYGRIVVGPGSPVMRLVVQVNFTVTVQIISDYYGSLELENERYALMAYNQGSPMRYRVHFPVTSPLPRITWAAVNGETICSGPGDILRPNQYLTTFSLQHTSFIRGQGGDRPLYVPPTQRPQTNVIDYFEVNGVRPKEPSRPVYELTSKPASPFLGNQNFNNVDRPFQRPSQRPPVNMIPNRPVIEEPTDPIYVEPVTQAARPQRPTEEIFYYPDEPVTQTIPKPNFVKPRPVNQSPISSSEDVCGVVGGSIPLIHQGTPYNRGDVPWLVAIYKTSQNNVVFICAGTLVSDRHVITAAHCMFMQDAVTSYKHIKVKIGVYDLSTWDDDFTVNRNLVAATKHEAYNSSSLQNDILILKLNVAVKFNEYIRPACLWTGDTAIERIVGFNGTVAGWGEQYNNGPKAGIPHWVELPIVHTDTCRASNAAFHQLTSNHTLCAGDLNGSGPCRGDSGGGLYLKYEGKWRLRGVVSISLRGDLGTCNLNEYLVFTDTAQFLPWIRKILQT